MKNWLSAEDNWKDFFRDDEEAINKLAALLGAEGLEMHDLLIKTLKDIFRKPNEAAYELTMKVHETGQATVATLPYEIAEQKATEVTNEARNLGYPLKVQLQEDK